ncbi:G-protein coupled receptor 39-like [Paramormyrops kingsleyae]|uniref:G protein-coupled receptor 39 n=1 Tax=Paramormyrops kingsleyae TaxID=1676925 RepID=A0A3B3R5I3_9TELE|nr:G-protein coupled receptor 39-like [Paramormyrops kingsleyae]
MDREYEIVEELKLEDWKDLEQVTPVKVFLTVLYIFILLIGIVGNSLTIKVTQVLRKNGYLQKNVTDHMVSLACSDLLVLLIGMPVELYSAIWFPFSSTSGNVSCKIYNFVFETCSYATILNVATLSFERYIAICHPLKYKSFSASHTIKLIIFAWVTSVLVAIPLLFATGTEGPRDLMSGQNSSSSLTDGTYHLEKELIQNLTFCTNLTSMWGIYRSSIFVAFIVYIIVLLSVGVMCKRMIHVLSSTNKNTFKKSTIQDTNSRTFVPKHESSKVKEARKQTILFLVLIVAALAGCWMPNQIRRLMTAVKSKANWTMPYFKSYVILHPISDTFFYISSVLNPFLYNLSSRQFRRVFVQVLLCKLTITHVNKRHVRQPDISSTRSSHALLNQGCSTRISKKPHKFTTFQSPDVDQSQNPIILPETDSSTINFSSQCADSEV